MEDYVTEFEKLYNKTKKFKMDSTCISVQTFRIFWTGNERQTIDTIVFPGFKWPPFFFFLNRFKLNLEERHLACGFKCTPVTKTYFCETPLFVNEAQIPCTKE